jgi:hypothetical protein
MVKHLTAEKYNLGIKMCIRCAVAPIKIETGKYEGILIENRICFFAMRVT